MVIDKAAHAKRNKTKDLWREGKPQFHTVLSNEESMQFDLVQAAWKLPSKAETFRWMLKDCHERTTTIARQTIVDVLNGIRQDMADVRATVASVSNEQDRFRTDLTRDVMRLVERAGNAADRITMVTETATERIGGRVENSIAITRQMEMDLKEQLAAANKMLYATLLRIKIEQAYLPPHIKETLIEGMKQAGLAAV